MITFLRIASNRRAFQFSEKVIQILINLFVLLFSIYCYCVISTLTTRNTEQQYTVKGLRLNEQMCLSPLDSQ